MGPAAGGTNVGLDERRRRRAGRAHLGRRALWRQYVRRIQPAARAGIRPPGKLLKSFGAGLMIFPHGFHVDGQATSG